MEKENLSEPNATYKPVPEKDMEDEAVSRPTSLGKFKSAGETDGADEKMLPDEETKVGPNSNININDVKLAVNEKQNGDAKLDIGEPVHVFGGMDKEELMKYANDPYWVRLRWFLFIGFWLLWAAMLVGAIMIIYAAPKCEPPPPRTWWQEGPLMEVHHDTNPEDLKSLSNVKGVILTWLQDAYKSIDESHNVIKQIKQANDLGIKVIIDLDPSTSEEWFEYSVTNAKGLYGDYYVWLNPKATGNGANPQGEAPNNWLNIYDENPWKYNETRNQFYYAPLRSPLLNFRSENVISEFIKVIKNFVAQGVSGIRLRNSPFLLVDPEFKDEAPSYKNIEEFHLGQYGFYAHDKTEHLPELGSLLYSWRKVFKNLTEDGPFMVKEDLRTHINSYKLNESLVIDLPLKTGIFERNNVSEILNSLNYTLKIDNIDWPLWKVNSSNNSIFPRDVVEIVTSLLPGAVLVDFNSSLNQDVLEVRQSPSIMRGEYELYTVNKNSVFAFTRVASGNPGFLVALNANNETVTVDLTKEIDLFKKVDEVTIRLYSDNYKEVDFREKGQKKKSSNIPISAKSVIVLSYVPPKKINKEYFKLD